MAFCGNCGERAGSAGCCTRKSAVAPPVKVVAQAAQPVPARAAPAVVRVVAPAAVPVVPAVAAPVVPVVVVPVVSMAPAAPPAKPAWGEEEPDSDHEEEAELYTAGQVVATEWGPGTVLRRFDEGGLQAWVLHFDRHGDRIIDLEDLTAYQPPRAKGKRKWEAVSASPAAPVVVAAPPPPPAAPAAPAAIRPAPATVVAVPRAHHPAAGGGAVGGGGAGGGIEATVTKWLDDKGYGFVSPQGGGQDIYVMRRILEGRALIPGKRVTVEAEDQGHYSGRLVCISCRGEGVMQ